MATITIEVPDDLAERYQRASTLEREHLTALVCAYFKALHKRKVQELQALMTQIGEQAERNGLTPEILEQLLNEQ